MLGPGLDDSDWDSHIPNDMNGKPDRLDCYSNIGFEP